MKHKKQTQVVEEESEQDQSNSQEDNGSNETTNGHLSEEDKEKGNLKNFTISKKSIKKLKAHNIEFLYPVQVKSYATIYEQKDCLIQASNGAGKTLAFVIPIVELLQSDKSVQLVPGRGPRVLVVVPTRESTKKVSDDFQSIVNDLSIATIFTTKKKSDDQETAITNGCDVLVATPDRLQEFINNEKVDLSQLKHVVINEIASMLDSPVIDHIKAILKSVFTSGQETKAQLIISSESISDTVRKITKKYLTNDAVTINMAEKNAKEQSADDDDDEDSAEPMNGSSANGADKTNGVAKSLLSKLENFTTYQLTSSEEIKSVGFVFTMLRKCFGDDFDAKGTISQVAFTKDFLSAVFDLPSELDEQLQSYWKDSARIQMGPITELPELDEASMNDSSYSRGGNKPSRGGAGGNRNAGRSNACFNCQKEGHKSWECPDSSGSQRNGGNKSGGGGGGGGGCFNCGKDGHKSYECSEPKKAGGRPSFGGGGGERSNACFNCGQDGHKSFECSEPKKAGGRPSFGGGGGRGGGRGGARGGGPKRSFGTSHENGFNSGETTSKKIKFDDDD
ncbi:unnamed protein product [Rotaria magnacalcarata]|uniref:RNA helicase n=4 Tax=Rotaria magnacalcarata TaxID=392030 RepID=A0A816L6A5_9BILA|nr:unnamed protein product [Rotaria magnacalcarata]CAF1655284.1 unnamed protein product [Rotaria magnacalcarata]CAF1932040.1 unnamed protein product [Rotaria magnacalcarata]CAF3780764.1 unnamed protein product [Rotaria magnacalcarata]